MHIFMAYSVIINEILNKEFFPSIKIFVQIFVTPSISTATTEWSFSTLNNYIHSAMTEFKLNGLVIFKVFKDRLLEIDLVANEFGKKK